MERDYTSISPSAKSLLLTKSLTEIPFIKDAARLVFGNDALKAIAEKTNDPFFTRRLVHFEHRYWSVDLPAHESANQNIIEISSGFSFRGLSMALQNPGITYIDTDLPEVTELKIQLTQQLLSSLQLKMPVNLTMQSLNALDETAFNNAIQKLKPGPVTIINEGLLVYLNRNEKIKLCRIIHPLLALRGGCWITADIYIKKDIAFEKDYPANEFLKQHNVEENKFDSFEDAFQFFSGQGFNIGRSTGSVKDKLSSLKYLDLAKLKQDDLGAGSRIRETWVLTVN